MDPDCNTASAADPLTKSRHDHQDRLEHLALLLLRQKALLLGQNIIARFFLSDYVIHVENILYFSCFYSQQPLSFINWAGLILLDLINYFN